MKRYESTYDSSYGTIIHEERKDGAWVKWEDVIMKDKPIDYRALFIKDIIDIVQKAINDNRIVIKRRFKDEEKECSD